MKGTPRVDRVLAVSSQSPSARVTSSTASSGVTVSRKVNPSAPLAKLMTSKPSEARHCSTSMAMTASSSSRSATLEVMLFNPPAQWFGWRRTAVGRHRLDHRFNAHLDIVEGVARVADAAVAVLVGRQRSNDLLKPAAQPDDLAAQRL